MKTTDRGTELALDEIRAIMNKRPHWPADSYTISTLTPYTSRQTEKLLDMLVLRGQLRSSDVLGVVEYVYIPKDKP